MKTFKQYLEETGRCWAGYKPVKNKTAFSKGSCVKEDELNEMGAGGAGVAVAGPTNVTGPQSGTDPQSATAVDMNKRKRKYPTVYRKALK
jgi:hypothetical protein